MCDQDDKVSLENIKNDETRWIVEKIGDKYLFKTIKSVPNCVQGSGDRSEYLHRIGWQNDPTVIWVTTWSGQDFSNNG